MQGTRGLIAPTLTAPADCLQGHHSLLTSRKDHLALTAQGGSLPTPDPKQTPGAKQVLAQVQLVVALIGGANPAFGDGGR